MPCKLNWVLISNDRYIIWQCCCTFHSKQETRWQPSLSTFNPVLLHFPWNEFYWFAYDAGDVGVVRKLLKTICITWKDQWLWLYRRQWDMHHCDHVPSFCFPCLLESSLLSPSWEVPQNHLRRWNLWSLKKIFLLAGLRKCKNSTSLLIDGRQKTHSIVDNMNEMHTLEFFRCLPYTRGKRLSHFYRDGKLKKFFFHWNSFYLCLTVIHWNSLFFTIQVSILCIANFGIFHARVIIPIIIGDV